MYLALSDNMYALRGRKEIPMTTMTATTNTTMTAVARPSGTATTRANNNPIVTIGLLAAITKTEDGDSYGYRTTMKYGGYSKAFEGQGKGYTYARTELEALLTALRALKKGHLRINVVTTSKYIQMNLQDLQRMRARNWNNRIGEPVTYQDLWEEIGRIQKEKALFITVNKIDRDDERIYSALEHVRALAKHEKTASIMEVSRK